MTSYIFFILSTTTLFTAIQSMSDSSYNWFDAQKQCFGHGLTIEKNQSGQPYWTGVYRRLTPWINIIGCYSNSIESLQDVTVRVLITSSVGLCQEMCFHKNGYKFALKMNICLCIGSDIRLSPKSGLSPSKCTYRCEDYSDDKYLRDCGGESAYNIYEIQEVEFKLFEYTSMETYLCLSLQCSELDIRFLPQDCSKMFGKICGYGYFVIPENSYARSWISSMEQCRKSQPSAYLSGNFDLNNPHLVCEHVKNQHKVVWVGVARQIYTTFDKGGDIKEEQKETFLECQMCTENNCRFRRCSDSLAISVYCNSISDTSTLALMLNRSTSKELLFMSSSTTANSDDDQFASTNDTLQRSGVSDDLGLEISLPLILGVITLLFCAVGMVLYNKRSKMAKTGRTPKVDIDSLPKIQVYSELDFDHSNPSFAIEHCYQHISNLSNSSNESPYINSEEDVVDHLRDKQSRKTGVDIVYQNASTDIY